MMDYICLIIEKLIPEFDSGNISIDIASNVSLDFLNKNMNNFFWEKIF